MKPIVLGYVIVGILAALWSDAMDNRYGVKPGAGRGWLVTTVFGAMWPIMVPLAMAAIAFSSDGWGRYQTLGSSSAAIRARGEEKGNG